jgi:hypothetical protein
MPHSLVLRFQDIIIVEVDEGSDPRLSLAARLLFRVHPGALMLLAFLQQHGLSVNGDP